MGEPPGTKPLGGAVDRRYWVIGRRQLLVLLGVAYVGYCILVVPLGRALVVFGDSSRYAQGSDVLSAVNPGILTSLLYAPLGDLQVILIVQMGIAAFSWLCLAAGLVRMLPGTPGIILATVALFYSLTEPIVGWQWAQLTEGLSISTLVLWLGCAVNLSQSRRVTPWAYALLVAGLLAILARPQIAVVVLPIEVLVLFLVARRHRPRKVEVGAWGLLLATQAGYAAVRTIMASRVDWLQMSYGLRNFWGKPSYQDYAGEAFASCRPVADYLAGQGPEPDIFQVQASCPETTAWLLSSASSGTAFLLHRPIAAVQEFWNVMKSGRHAYVFPPEDLPLYVQGPPGVPQPWADLVLPSGYPLPALLAFSLAMGVVFVTIMSATVLVTRARVLVGSAFAAFAALYLLLTWAADGAELHRHMFPVLGLLPLLAFLTPPLLLAAKGRDGPVPQTEESGSRDALSPVHQ